MNEKPVKTAISFEGSQSSSFSPIFGNEYLSTVVERVLRMGGRRNLLLPKTEKFPTFVAAIIAYAMHISKFRVQNFTS